jgi:hypothetical protein
MSGILSDTEQAVVQTMTMRLNEKQALFFLKQNGIDISRRTYFRHKKKVDSLTGIIFHALELLTIWACQVYESTYYMDWVGFELAYRRVQLREFRH